MFDTLTAHVALAVEVPLIFTALLAITFEKPTKPAESVVRENELRVTPDEFFQLIFMVLFATGLPPMMRLEEIPPDHVV